MAGNYSLLLRQNPASLSSKTAECEVYTDLTSFLTNQQLQGWSRNIAFLGGPDLGSFKLYGDPNLLGHYWTQWLGMDLAEVDMGFTTWSGQIIKLVLYAGSMGMSRDIQKMMNRVRGEYTFSSLTRWSDWVTNDYSIAKYGIREEEITGITGLEADAIDQCEMIVRLNGYPPRLPAASMGKVTNPYLHVFAAGYFHSLNNKYVPTTMFDYTPTVEETLDDIITDSSYLNVGSIAANDFRIDDGWGKGARGAEAVTELLQMSDDNYDIYRGWIDYKRNFYYKVFDSTPDYYVREGEVYGDQSGMEKIAPRQLRPGVYRIMDFPVSGAMEEDWFLDRRDVLIEDINVDAKDKVSFRPLKSNVSEYMTQMQQNLPSAYLPWIASHISTTSFTPPDLTCGE